MLLRILLLAFFMLPAQSFYDFKINNIDGAPIRLSDFKGKKILVVNTASECGYTPQYAELEKLYQKYKNKLVVIAFPANNFGGQEPGSNKQIKQFCSKNYGVSFLVAEKVSVKGGDIHPLFQWLTSQPNPDFKGDINWNFEKFLLDENGKLVHRFRSKVKPLDPAITAAI
jgi:glutathione peroxidase